MAARFFGQFLVEEGAITSEQLREALDLMDADYEKLGELAIKQGYLSEAEVTRLHREQRYVDLPFGALAVKRGALTEDQVDSLLTIQRASRLRIGDALSKLGFLTDDEIETRFKSFKFEQDTVVGRSRMLPAELAGSKLAEFLVGFFPKITQRMSDIRLKLVEGCPVGDRHMRENTASVMISGDESLLLTLSVDDDFAEKLMWGLLGGELGPDDERPTHEDTLGEYVSIVSGNSLMALQEEGVHGRIAPPSYDPEPPEGGVAFVLVSTIGSGTLVMTPMPSSKT